jgi:hypothetical protein
MGAHASGNKGKLVLGGSAAGFRGPQRGDTHIVQAYGPGAGGRPGEICKLEPDACYAVRNREVDFLCAVLARRVVGAAADGRVAVRRVMLMAHPAVGVA